MATDCLARYGHEPAPLDSQTIEKFDAFLPPFWSRSNPIDMIGDASAQRFRQTLDVCLEAANIDAILIIFIPQAMTGPVLVAEEVVSAMHGRRFPVFTCWMGGKRIGRAVEILNENGIPTYETPERAISAFMFMVEYAGNQEALLETPPRLTQNMVFGFEKAGMLFSRAPRDRFMPESDSIDVLAAYGLPVIRTGTAITEDEASRLGQGMGYPLVMKLHSPVISHKTEAGGVHLDLCCDTDVRAAFGQIVHPHAGTTPEPESRA
jgi:acetyltransferase